MRWYVVAIPRCLRPCNPVATLRITHDVRAGGRIAMCSYETPRRGVGGFVGLPSACCLWRVNLTSSPLILGFRSYRHD